MKKKIIAKDLSQVLAQNLGVKHFTPEQVTKEKEAKKFQKQMNREDRSYGKKGHTK